MIESSNYPKCGWQTMNGLHMRKPQKDFRIPWITAQMKVGDSNKFENILDTWADESGRVSKRQVFLLG